MARYTRSKAVLAIWAALCLLRSPIANGLEIVLDTTTNGASGLSGSSGIYNLNFKAFSFTTNTINLKLEQVRLALFSNGALNQTFSVSIYSTSSNVPVTSLKTSSFTQTVTSSGSYYTFPFTYTLLPSTTYALVLSSTNPTNELKWANTSPQQAPISSVGYVFQSARTSSNQGASWSVTTATFNGFTLYTTPEPGAVVSGLIAAISLVYVITKQKPR